MNNRESNTTLSIDRRWFLLVVLLAFIGLSVYLLRSILMPFLIGAAIAYLFNPVVVSLEKRGMSRTAATFTIAILSAVLVILVGALVLPILFDQAMSLAFNLPIYIAQLLERIENVAGSFGISSEDLSMTITDNVSQRAGDIAAWGFGLAGRVVQSGSMLVNLIGLIFVTPVVAFYLLRDWRRILATFISLLPYRYSPVILEQMREMNSVLGGFLRGQALVSLSLAVFYGIGLWFSGLSFGFGLGIAAGLLSAIPLIGGIAAFAIITVFALFQFGLAQEWVRLGLVAGIFVIGQVLENNILTPKLIGDRIAVHPVWIIFGVLAGAALLGIPGAIVAVPVVSVIGVLARFIVKLYTKSDFFSDAPRDPPYIRELDEAEGLQERTQNE